MHRASDWGCDFVCVRRVLFRPLHVFFVVRLANREILHFELTRHPTDGWAALLAVTFRGNSDPSVTLAAWDWGPMLAARHVWRELGRAWPERRDATPLSDRALVLVANRLAAPGSEHGLARWLETDFVCDRVGRQWLPAWREDAERQASKTPRVRVQMRQLKQWYRTLDQLLERKSDIERALYLTLRDLFSLRVDFVFYDVTSTYFEGSGPPKKGAYGHSRDDKPRNPQVLVGLVLVDGWPIAHHVFQGNWRDPTRFPKSSVIWRSASGSSAWSSSAIAAW